MGKKTLVLFLALLLAAGAIATGEAVPRALGGFFKQGHQLSDMDRDARGEYERFHQHISGLGVSREVRDKYPELTEAITKINQEEYARGRKLRETMGEEAARMRREAPQYFHAFQHRLDITLRRADTLAVSFIQKDFTFGGGPHGMSVWQGVNLETKTGRPIPLKDVVRDTAALGEIIIKRLQADYPEVSFFDMEKTVRDKAGAQKLNWTLDPLGLTFYFNPYEIASYADGLLTVTILYKEHPELFREKYTEAPAAYGQPFCSYYPLVTCLGEGREKDVLSLIPVEGAVKVTVNGRAFDFEPELKDLRPVLVHLADGRNFLYIDGGEKGSTERKILVLELKEGEAVSRGLQPYSFRRTISVSPAVQVYWNFLTDPLHFTLDGTESFFRASVSKSYAAGSAGPVELP